MADDLHSEIHALEVWLETPEAAADPLIHRGKLDQLSRAYQFLHALSHEPAHLEIAVLYLEDAFSKTPSSNEQEWRRRMIHLALVYMKLFDITSAESYMTAAVIHIAVVVIVTPSDDPHRLPRIGLLIKAFEKRYKATSDSLDLDALIYNSHLFARLSAPDQALEQGSIKRLCDAYRERIRFGMPKPDLATHIGRLKQTAVEGNRSRFEVAMGYWTMALMETEVLELTRSAYDANRAIDCFDMALSAMDFEDPLRPHCLSDFGWTCRAKWTATQDAEALELAIRKLKEARHVASQRQHLHLHQHQAETVKIIYRLATCHADQFKMSGDMSDLELAREQLGTLRGRTPDTHEMAGDVEALRCDVLWQVYKTNRTVASLDAALQQFQRAHESAAHHPRQQWTYRMDLATGYRQRAEMTQKMEDLDEWIRRAQDLVSHVPGHETPSRQDALGSLAEGLYKKYQRTHDRDDLDATLTALEDVMSLMSLTDKQNPKLLLCGTHLINLARTAYETSRSLQDLDLAIERGGAVLKCYESPFLRPPSLLTLVADLYFTRYKVTSDGEESLSRAIHLYRQSHALLPSRHPDKAGRLLRCCEVLLIQHRRTQTPPSLNEASTLLGEVFADSDAMDEHRLRLSRQVAQALEDRSRRAATSALATPASAPSTLVPGSQGPDQLQSHVHSHPEGSDDQLRALMQLVWVQAEMYVTNREPSLLEDWIQNLQRLVDAPVGPWLAAAEQRRHRCRVHVVHTLGVAYSFKYLSTNSLVDLVIALQLLRQAVDETPANGPIRARYLCALALAHWDKYVDCRKKRDLDEAINLYEEASDHVSSPPAQRICASRHLVTLYVARKHYDVASTEARETLLLVPLLDPRFNDDADKRHILDDVNALASEAFGLSLIVGLAPFEAIRVLELYTGPQPHCQACMPRSLERLRYTDADRADAFLIYTRRLNDPNLGSATGEPVHGEPVNGGPANGEPNGGRVTDDVDLGRALQDLIGQLHTSDAHADFLRPWLYMDASDASASARVGGPIVLVHACRLRSDALIIQGTGITILRLRRLHLDDIRRHRDAAVTVDQVDETLLTWLWDAIAEPVLDSLGIHQPPVDVVHGTWPRIRWVLTGDLAGFPIHAAGYHRRDDTHRKVLERVISSYTFSVQGAVDSLRTPVNDGSDDRRDEAVLVAAAAGHLPHVTTEVARVSPACAAMRRIYPAASSEGVLTCMDTCDVFHFAGEARSRGRDLSQHALVITDRDELRVADLRGRRLLATRDPFLAYLSVHDRDSLRHPLRSPPASGRLPLLAGFQLAGFRHVIGTLWDPDYLTSIHVARETYRRLQVHRLDGPRVAEALHHTLRALRAQWAEPISDHDLLATMIMGRSAWAIRQDDEPEVHVADADEDEEPVLEALTFDDRLSQLGYGHVLSRARARQAAEAPPDHAHVGPKTSLQWVPFVHYGT